MWCPAGGARPQPCPLCCFTYYNSTILTYYTWQIRKYSAGVLVARYIANGRVLCHVNAGGSVIFTVTLANADDAPTGYTVSLQFNLRVLHRFMIIFTIPIYYCPCEC